MMNHLVYAAFMINVFVKFIFTLLSAMSTISPKAYSRYLESIHLQLTPMG